MEPKKPNPEQLHAVAKPEELQQNWRQRKRRYDMPVENIETEGEKQLKELVRKQMETNILLKDQLHKKKKFTPASLYDPLAAGVSGKQSLEEYKDLYERDAQLEKLRSCELTEDEIKIVMSDNTLKKTSVNDSKYGTDPQVMKDVYEKITKKISDKNIALKSYGKSFQGAKPLSRHEMDLEKSLTRDRAGSKLLNILVTHSEDKEKNYEDDPAAIELKNILRNIEKSTVQDEASSDKIMNEDLLQSHSEQSTTIGESKKLTLPSTGCSECDRLQQQDRYFVGPLLKSEYAYYEECDPCKQKRHRQLEEEKQRRMKMQSENVNKDKSKVVQVFEKGAVVETIPPGIIKKYKLSVDQIKSIPKFCNYSPGKPSKVLYIKNLSSKVTKEDLMSMFDQFSSNKDGCEVKLLNGKMRGQAFIHYKNEQNAMDALEIVNGYEFKGKPIIIQYGKKG